MTTGKYGLQRYKHPKSREDELLCQEGCQPSAVK
jgi:hypothetical protein